VQAEFQAGAIGRIRKSFDQLQPAARKRDSLPICKSAKIVVRSLLKIPCGMLIVRPRSKCVASSAAISLALAIEGLRLFANSQVELNTPERGNAFIQHVLIQSMDETTGSALRLAVPGLRNPE
jgi:hypothetical protein